MKPEVRVFSREQPCTKLELWNCFRGSRRFRNVQVDEAHVVIGKNAPRYMIGKGYLERVNGKTDYYRLTDSGRRWLTVKFKAYLRNHPEDLERVDYPPSG